MCGEMGRVGARQNGAAEQAGLALWEGGWGKERSSWIDKISEQMRGRNNEFLEGKGVGGRISAD